MAQRPNLPQDTYSVTKEEKDQIVELGRELTKFIYEFARKNERFHFKIVVGAFQYFTDLFTAKRAAIGDDILIVQDTLAKYELGTNIDEPFVDKEPVAEETKEEKKARLLKELAELDAPALIPEAPVETPVDADVANAMSEPAKEPVGEEAKQA